MAFGNTGKMSGLLVKLFMDTTSFDKDLKTSQRKLGDFKKAIGTFSVAMGAAAIPIAAVAAGFLAITKKGAEFEMQMSRVATMMGKGGTAGAMKLLGDTALDVAAQTEFSATQIASAMEELAKAGMGAEAIKGTINSVAAIATIGGVTLEQSAGLFASTMKQFNLAAEDTEDMANMIAVALTTSKLSFESLTAAMVYAGPAAATFGMSLEGTLETVAAFADLGVEGSIGGTALRMGLQQLLKPSAAAKASLGALGTTAEKFLAVVEGEGFLTALKQLEGMSASQAVDIFGKRAASVMAGVATMQSHLESSLTKTEKAMEKRDKVAAEAQIKIMKNTSGELLKIQSATESVMIRMYQTFGSEARDVLAFVQRVIAQAADHLKDASERIATNFKVAFALFNNNAVESTSVGQALGAALEVVLHIAAAMVGALGLLSLALQPLIRGFQLWAETLVTAANFFKVFIEIMFGSGNAMDTSSKKMDGMVGTAKEFNRVANDVLNFGEEWLRFFGSGLPNAIVFVTDRFADLKDAIKDMFGFDVSDTMLFKGMAALGGAVKKAKAAVGMGSGDEGPVDERAAKKAKAAEAGELAKVNAEAQLAVRDLMSKLSIAETERRIALLKLEEDSRVNEVRLSRLTQSLEEKKLNMKMEAAVLAEDSSAQALVAHDLETLRLTSTKERVRINEEWNEKDKKALDAKAKESKKITKQEADAFTKLMRDKAKARQDAANKINEDFQKRREELSTLHEAEVAAEDSLSLAKIEGIEDLAEREHQLAIRNMKIEMRNKKAAIDEQLKPLEKQMRKGLISPEQYAAIESALNAGVAVLQAQITAAQNATAPTKGELSKARGRDALADAKAATPTRDLINQAPAGFLNGLKQVGATMMAGIGAMLGPMTILMESGLMDLLNIFSIQKDAQRIAKEQGVSLEKAAKMAVQERVNKVRDFITGVVQALPIIIGEIVALIPILVSELAFALIEAAPKIVIQVVLGIGRLIKEWAQKIIDALAPLGRDAEFKDRKRELKEMLRKGEISRSQYKEMLGDAKQAHFERTGKGGFWQNAMKQSAEMMGVDADTANKVTGLGGNQSSYSGISYVPKTLRGVTLHKGERVVPAHENKNSPDLTSPSSNYGSSASASPVITNVMIDGVVVDGAIVTAHKDGKASGTKRMMSRVSNRKAGISTPKKR